MFNLRDDNGLISVSEGGRVGEAERERLENENVIDKIDIKKMLWKLEYFTLFFPLFDTQHRITLSERTAKILLILMLVNIGLA